MNCEKKVILVSSDIALDYFPGNNQNTFTYIFNSPINLEGNWEFSLRDIVITLSNEVNDTNPILVDVELDQITGNVRGGVESTVLKRVIFNPVQGDKSISASFNHSDGVVIRTPYLDRLDFVIIPVRPKNLSFDPLAAVYITLVLEKRY